MPVVINEFEVVPTPPPERGASPQEAPAGPTATPAGLAREVEKQVRAMEERRARVRAY